MNRPPTHIRSMHRWWLRLPYYRWYLLREATCVFVAGYALVLLAGLLSLGVGRDSYDAWRNALSSPLSIVWHAMATIALGYHAWTWFKVLPKTLPFLRVAGRRIPDRAIVGGAVLGALVASGLLFALAWVSLR